MRCIVLGANGQDGSYLAERLTGAGDEVWGVGLEAAASYVAAPGFHYAQCDLSDSRALRAVLLGAEPDEIYHLAAVHGSAGFQYEQVWGGALDVNVKSLHSALEYVRLHRPGTRVFYASSAKVYGEPAGTITLSSPKVGACLYSITKLAAEALLNHYRRAHGIESRIAYFFNHESPRRASSFFIPKIVGILAAALRDPSHREEIFSLDFYCDWGCAQEYMSLAREFLRSNDAPALIFASGRTWYAREMVTELFGSYNLDPTKHIAETTPSLRPTTFQVDIAETARVLGAGPQRSIIDVCRECVDAVLSTSERAQ